MSTETRVVFTDKQQAELQTFKAPTEIPADHIYGKTLVSLISPGTELHSAYLGDNFPAFPGYAGVFEVERVGSQVNDITPGQLVFCTGPHGIGGHRSHQLCPRQAVIPVPEGLSAEAAAHARLMGVSMTSLSTTAARPPAPILIMGLGPIGHLAAQSFKACGYEVIAVDVIESRRELAVSKGISNVLAKAPTDRKGPDGIALAIDCSGHEQAILDACHAVRKRGEVVLLGGPWKQYTDITAHEVFKAVYRGYVTLRSGWEWEIARHPENFRNNSVFGNFSGALRWLAEGRVDVSGLYDTLDPAKAPQVYEDLLDRKIDALSVIFDWRGFH